MSCFTIGLAVMRFVAALAIEIPAAHIDRIDAEMMRNVQHHPLYPHHALRDAEAAKRGV